MNTQPLSTPELQRQLRQRGYRLELWRWRHWRFWPMATAEILAPDGRRVHCSEGPHSRVTYELALITLGMAIGQRLKTIDRQSHHFNHDLKGGHHVCSQDAQPRNRGTSPDGLPGPAGADGAEKPGGGPGDAGSQPR